MSEPRVLPDLSQLTYGQMRNAIIGLDVCVCSALLPDRTYGLYDESKRLILIDRRMTYTRKRCTLMHELVHWLHGDRDLHRRHRQPARTTHTTGNRQTPHQPIGVRDRRNHLGRQTRIDRKRTQRHPGDRRGLQEHAARHDPRMNTKKPFTALQRREGQ